MNKNPVFPILVIYTEVVPTLFFHRPEAEPCQGKAGFDIGLSRLE